MGDIIVCSIIAIAIFFSIKSIKKAKKKGCCSCSDCCGCSNNQSLRKH